MADRPILFSALMVNAILTGRKTQTRRIVKPQPTAIDPRAPGLGILAAAYRQGDFAWPSKGCAQAHTISCKPNGPDGWAHENSPYGVPGDRLWVRETLRRGDRGGWLYGADSEEVQLPAGDPRVSEMIAWAHHKEADHCVSIHMPRWASRITLEITSVRVERLQAISRGDAMSEGCPFPNMADGDDPRKWFADLWAQINSAESWEANPWVWAIDFKRTTE